MNTRRIADFLTVTRFIIACAIVVLGTTQNPDTLPSIVLLLIAAWYTDSLDGPVARMNPSLPSSWVGEHDLETDIIVGIAILAYLAQVGLMATGFALYYLLICSILYLRTRSRYFASTTQALPYTFLILVAMKDARGYGIAAIVSLLLLAVVTWPKFPQKILPEFMDGLSLFLRQVIHGPSYGIETNNIAKGDKSQ